MATKIILKYDSSILKEIVILLPSDKEDLYLLIKMVRDTMSKNNDCFITYSVQTPPMHLILTCAWCRCRYRLTLLLSSPGQRLPVSGQWQERTDTWLGEGVLIAAVLCPQILDNGWGAMEGKMQTKYYKLGKSIKLNFPNREKMPFF